MRNKYVRWYDMKAYLWYEMKVYDAILLLQYAVCIAFYMWCYVLCGLMIYYVRCSGSLLCIFRFGAWLLSSSGAYGAGGGDLHVLYFAVITLG